MTMSFVPDKTGQAAQPVALAAGLWLLTGTLTLSGSYATNGDAVDLTAFFPAGKTIRSAVFISEGRAVGFEYDITNKKIKVFGINPAAASLDLGTIEHPAAAYNAALTTPSIPVAILLKG